MNKKPPLIGYEQSMEKKRKVFPEKTSPAMYWDPRRPRHLGSDSDEEEDVYEDVGFTSESGRWGDAGSGILFTTGSHILLLHRSPYVEEPGTWGIPGGAVPQTRDDNGSSGSFMNVYESAKKETREEIGIVPTHYVMEEYIYEEPEFVYTTYIARVSEEDAEHLRPVLNWENDEYAWVSLDELGDYDLHFGVLELLNHVNPFF